MKQKNSLGKQILKNRNNYIFMAPYLLVFTLFTIIPVVLAICLSFTYFNVLEPARFTGLENYLNLFLKDEVFQLGLQNTLIFAVITGPAGYLLSLLFAWIINELPPKLRALLTLIFYAPSLTGGAVYVWTIIFNNDANGYVNSILYNLGFISAPIEWLTSPSYMMFVCVVVILWMSLGTSFLTFIAGLQGVDTSLYEAAAVDGVRNRYQEFWYVTIPSLKPQLLFGAVMSITSSFGVGNVITGLVGYPSNDYAVHTAVHHMQDYGGTRFEMGYACAVATVLFIAMLLANTIIQKVIRKVGN